MNLCFLGAHDWRWHLLAGRSLHGTDTCRRCGTRRSHCLEWQPGACTDPQHDDIQAEGRAR